MRTLADNVRSGEWKGASGKQMTDIVHIGIGGSHLGPELACEALCYSDNSMLRVHFLSNIDGGQFDRIVTPLDPTSTLFIVASKSFTTTETLLNATSAKSWLTNRFPEHDAIARHFVAITGTKEPARQFGIPATNIFPLWDWVGGRYSLWSAIGLPIALKFGMNHFEMVLAGAAEMDDHFQHTPLSTNAPVLLGLIGLWNNNFLSAESYAVIPYDDRLRHLPTYLQQLEMESNGKRATLSNTPIEIPSAPITWGGPGTNAQHTFFQLLHQGTRNIPVDFIVSMTHPTIHSEHHAALVANCLAQGEALARGSSAVEASLSSEIDGPALYKDIPGNNPSTTISMDALTPQTLGSLIALYEHKTYVESVIWDINAFDQWGVEAGKTIARNILKEFQSGRIDERHDPSTSALIRRYMQNRK
jgi:glucose-6-phosphate isomerase